KGDYEKAYEIDPENSLFDYRRGLQLLKQGDAKQSVEFLKKAAAKDSKNADVMKKLIQAQTAARDYQNALGSLKRAQELAPDDKSLKVLEGDLLLGQRKYSDARKIYQSLTKKDGADVFAKAQIGISSSYRESGDGAKSVSFMQETMENASSATGKRTEAKMWEELGRAFESIRSRDQARQAYEACIDIYNQYANCHCRLALAIGRGGEAVQAAKACQRVDPRGPLAPQMDRFIR
ncbi:MAG: tetratricopeptide repeat protein, partial [Myxococcota bacterium]